MDPTLLRPTIVLVLWTFVMWTWMYVTRLPAIRRTGMKLDPDAPRGAQMATLPASVRWKADNYNHLFEQPTLFYATTITLAVLGVNDAIDTGLAWTYVGLRIAHSVFQATVNKIEIRFALFLVSSLVLLALAIRTALALW